jgi:superfamily II DNA/RNA helicase
LPELTHVFILGIPLGPKVNGRVIDAYLHIAGRVGRFGRGGKVITVVEKGEPVDEGEEKSGITEAAKMLRILQEISVTAVQFEHFD